MRITLNDGRVLASEPTIARGNPENPLSDAEILEKYHSLADPILGRRRAAEIEHLVSGLAHDQTHDGTLLRQLLAPAN